MTPLYSQQKEMDDGSMLLTQWGYCRAQNAVRLGYAVNILAALVGLLLVPRLVGLWVCILVGASFGATYFTEQMPEGKARMSLAWAGPIFTVASYLVAVCAALGA
jgi:hypothetical protein